MNQPQQQVVGQDELPSLLQLVSLYGARLTTAAQMVWAQVSWQPDVLFAALPCNQSAQDQRHSYTLCSAVTRRQSTELRCGASCGCMQLSEQ
jgi:hypothetical protein